MAGATLARACLAVVCGLPGAGKTTLCRELEAVGAKGRFIGEDPVDVIRLSFDDVENELVEADRPDEQHAAGDAEFHFDSERWKKSREESFRRLRNILTGKEKISEAETSHLPSSVRRKTLILIDDNMHYRSMRYQCFGLARSAGAAYFAIYVDCDIATALQRNAARVGRAQVPSESLKKISETLEKPNPQEGEFGQPVLHLRVGGAEVTSTCSSNMTTTEEGVGTLFTTVSRSGVKRVRVDELWLTLSELWGAAPQRLLSEEEREAIRQAGRCANSASLAHAIDLRCRKAIGEVLSQLTALSVDGPKRGKVATALNASRKELLEACKVTSNSGMATGEKNTCDQVGSINNTERVEELEAKFHTICDAFLNNY